jgi:hypothetical protein
MNYAKRTDDNHREVIDAFRKAMPDATLFDASGAGKGFGDVVVGWKKQNFIFEIKDPAKCPSARSLTDAQKEFHLTWQGQIKVVHTAADMCAEIARAEFGRRMNL